MSDTTILCNGTLVTGGERPEVIDDGAVAWRGERIVAAGSAAEIRQRFAGASTLDARGGLILPGLVNLHHHFYSALARGLDPQAPMTDFPQVLDRLWWRLDRALDLDAVRLSALLSVADCVRWGCTTVFDHHASPSCIEGSLDAIAEAVELAGLSAVLCYEVSDRNGHDEAIAGIDENLRFQDAHRSDRRIRGVMGLHASFTLRDETLKMAAERQPQGAGCHIHMAEDPVDVETTREVFGGGPVQRLQRVGLLDERALLAHGIHLGHESYATLAHHGAVVIHNPESNANNGVGRLDLDRAANTGCLLGLGTDGMASNMLRALRTAFLMHRHAARDPSAGFDVLPSLTWNNVLVARRFFEEEPLLGELVAEAPADVIVIDAPPPTPIGGDNLFGHLVYGASEAPVRHTIARGRVLLEDFRHTTLDPQALAAQAREIAPGLWKRFHSLDYGTSYLG